MPEEQSSCRFPIWARAQMIDAADVSDGRTVALSGLDGRVGEWVVGQAVPTPDQCRRLAQRFEGPAGKISRIAGWSLP